MTYLFFEHFKVSDYFVLISFDFRFEIFYVASFLRQEN
jgi:hypothetical protein